MRKNGKNLLKLTLICLLFCVSFLPVSAVEKNNSNGNNKSLQESIQLIEEQIALASNNDEKKIKEPYIYPIIPGTSKWNNFESRDEMMNATQIPKEILENMATEALARTVIEHPLLSTIMLAYDDKELAFSDFLDDFNGAKELIKREDAAIQLVKLYADTPVLSIEQYQKQKDAAKSPIVDLYTKEAVLAVPQVFNLLDKDEVEALAIISNGKMIEKINNEVIYGTSSDTFFSIRSIIDNEEKFEEIKDVSAIQKSKFIVNKAVRDTSTTVKTPKGSSVSVTVFSSDFTASQKTAYNNEFKNSWPNATFVSTSTRMYNCHSYAWYSSSTSNKYWMNDPSKYMSDGSYKNAGYQNSGVGMKMY